MAEKVAVVSIYVAEAHAADEWPIRTDPKMLIDQHSCLKERLGCARSVKQEFGLDWELYVDSMDDQFHDTYGAWPTRAYVFDCDFHLEWMLQPKKGGYVDFADMMMYFQQSEL